MLKINKLSKVLGIFFITAKYLWRARDIEADFTILKGLWANELLEHFNIDLQIKGIPLDSDEPCIFVGNHISYLDILVLTASFPRLSFVSKQEVHRWPIIGMAAEKAQTIFVKRDSARSRGEALTKISESLIHKKQKLVIFPSGTTALKATTHWKKGAFKIAEKNGIKIQAFRIRYEPLRESAYIDDDVFFTHLWKIFEIKKIKVFLEFHDAIYIKDSQVSCSEWKKWCEEF